MTAAGLDYVSGGRFTLGIGASGPQVIEGFHGVRYDAPIGRTREIIDICRQVWRREKVAVRGQALHDPAAGRPGHGAGQAAQADQPPGARAIPILVAALGPKNVALAAEKAEGWQPIFFVPEKAQEVWGESLAAGKAKREPALGAAARSCRRSRSHQRGRRRALLELDGARLRRALRRRHGREGQELLQRRRPPLRLRGRGRDDPGPLPRRARRRRPRRPCPRSCCGPSR